MANCILITTNGNNSSNSTNVINRTTTDSTISSTINTSASQYESEPIVLSTSNRTTDASSDLTSVLKIDSNDVLNNNQSKTNYIDNELSENHVNISRLIHSNDTESSNSVSILKSTLIKSPTNTTALLEHLIDSSHTNKLIKQPINSCVQHWSTDRLDSVFFNQNRCCAEEKNLIRKELQKWSKNSLIFVGLQNIAQNLMGVEQWRKFNKFDSSIEQTNDEPIDWESNQVCSLCNSKTKSENYCSSETINLQNSTSKLIETSIIQFDSLNNNQQSTATNSQHQQFDQSTLSQLSSLLNLSTMTTNPITMTNSNNLLLNDTDHLNSLNVLISNENMANQNGSDLSKVKIESNHQNSSENQLNDNSSLLNNSNNHCMNSDLDNLSVKSETSSSASTIDQNNTMTIGENRTHFDTLAKLLSTKDKGLFEQMVDQMNPTPEQPLDLSLSSKKQFDLTDVLSSIYANSELVGKIKSSKTRLDGIKKRSYTEEELGRALNDIQSGKLGTRRAAALYKIPRSTLRNKVHKMNSGDKKMKTQLISTVDELLNNDIDKEECKSTTDHQLPVNDSLRELLKKKNFSSKSMNESSLNCIPDLASTSANLDNIQANLEIQQLLNLSQSLNSINNLNGLNNFNNINNSNSLSNLQNGLLINSLTGNLNNNHNINLINNNLNSYLDNNLLNSNHITNLNNNNLLNTAIAQFFNPQFNNALDLIKLINLIKVPEINNNNRLDIGENLLSDHHNLNESINSVLSANSGRSSALKMMNDHFVNHQNDDDTRSTLEDRSRRLAFNNLGNNDDHHTDDSNFSLTNEPLKKGSDYEVIRQKSTTDLNESMNSTNSLNNNILFSTLNLMNNPLNQFNLANLTNGLNNLSNLNNLTNLSNNFQLNLQSINDQNRANTLPNVNSGTDNQPATNTPTNATDLDPNRKRPKRGRYRNYNKSDLDEAVKAVQRGEMSVHKAGTMFSIPHSTLEYKVKERHLLRPSKRLKKQQQQEAAASQMNTLYPSTSVNANEPNSSGSSFQDQNDMSKTGKLKNALIGKQRQEQSTKFNNSMVDMSLIQKTLFQSTSNSMCNLQQPNDSTGASDLLKKLQENFKDDCFKN